MQVVRAVLSLFLSLFGLIKPSSVVTSTITRQKRVLVAHILGFEYDTHFTIDKEIRTVKYSQSWIPDCEYVTLVAKNRLRKNNITESSVFQQVNRGLFTMTRFENRLLALLPWFVLKAFALVAVRAQICIKRLVVNARTWYYEVCYRFIDNYERS